MSLFTVSSGSHRGGCSVQKQGARAGGRRPEDDLNVKRLSPWPTLEIAFLSVKEGEVNASVCLLPLQLIITIRPLAASRGLHAPCFHLCASRLALTRSHLQTLLGAVVSSAMIQGSHRTLASPQRISIPRGFQLPALSLGFASRAASFQAPLLACCGLP